jgi:hypothetical protein
MTAAAAQTSTPQPAAARVEAVRRPGRSGSADLFSSAASDDVMTSASSAPTAAAGAEKMTGARNENSVLFSLASLAGGPATGTPSSPAAQAASAPASAQMDLKALLSPSGNGARQNRSKIDDIMNLGGGAIYAPSLVTAPALAPPTVDLVAAADASADLAIGRSKDTKGMVLAISGGVALVAAAILAVTSLASKADTDKPAASAAASAAAAAPAVVAAGAPSAAPEPAPTESAAVAGAAPTAIAPGATPPAPAKEEKAGKAGVKVAAREDKGSATGAAGLEKVPSPTPAAPPAAVAAGGGGEGGAFDRAAALSALSAAASAAQACKKPDGPTGSGRIAITFAPSGNATTANVEGPPFAGTSVGGCVAARFRGTRVPPFGGAPVTVHKTFFIN